MTTKTDDILNASESAQRVAELVRNRLQLESGGSNLSDLDQQLTPYKTMYVRAGAIYGGNTAGMLKWFDERAQSAQRSEPPRANQFVYALTHDGLTRV